MSSKRRSKSLEHIASALVPPAAFAVVPNTPPPTPPPKNKKKFWQKRQKTPSPSPLMPTLMGVTMTARAVALDLDTSSTRSSPERRSRDASMQMEEFDCGNTSGQKSRRRGRSKGRRPQRTSETVIVERAQGESYQASRSDYPNQNDVEGGDSAVSMSDVQEFGYELEERQRRLEDKVQLQNDETREMVREVMTRQHADSLRRSGRSEGSFDIQDLDDDNQVLMGENSRLIQRNTGLVKDRKDLEAVSATLASTGKKGSPKSQVEQLLSDNDLLRETVQRLMVELDKYQENYGALPRKSTSKRRIEPEDLEPKPKWLTEPEFLSPLFISYDAQLKEKNAIIEMLKDHQDPNTKRKWDNLSDQNNLMTEEIQILMQQMELAKEKAARASKEYAKEVAKLSKALAVAQAEAEVSTEQATKLKDELDEVKKEKDSLSKELATTMPVKDHISAVNDLKQEMEIAKDTAVKEMAGALKKIKDIEEEKSSLTMELTDSKIKVKQMEGQIEALTQAYDKVQDKCKALDAELEDSDKRNKQCESHLAEVLRLMDKATAERDAFAALIEKEQRVSEQAMRSTMLGKWEMGKMEQTILQFKKQSAGHMTDITEKIRTLEENHQGKIREYHREMAHLRQILRQKQAALDDLSHEKRLMESELENVWQAATSENRRILDSFTKSKVLD